MRSLLAVQHTLVENLGTLGDALRATGIPYEYVRSQEGEPIPESAEGLGGLVVLGGPMGVYETERYPHLEEEIRLINPSCPLQTLNREGQQEADDLQLEAPRRDRMDPLGEEARQPAK
ncbi:MAG: hypothetical protein M3N18_05910, partial [Actinomycetota bacterium]|nr:hypothetical protein [Actinomycetota bacterium]